jgi:hypothetical protein
LLLAKSFRLIEAKTGASLPADAALFDARHHAFAALDGVSRCGNYNSTKAAMDRVCRDKVRHHTVVEGYSAQAEAGQHLSEVSWKKESNQ